MITLQDKLAVIERLIQDLRWTRNIPAAPEHRILQVLKAVFEDLLARQAGVPGVAEVELQRRVDAVFAAPTSMAAVNRELALAREVVSRWSVVRQALEAFGAAVERVAPEPSRRGDREQAPRVAPALPAREA